jgi:hypothetical protein
MPTITGPEAILWYGLTGRTDPYLTRLDFLYLVLAQISLELDKAEAGYWLDRVGVDPRLFRSRRHAYGVIKTLVEAVECPDEDEVRVLSIDGRTAFGVPRSG